MADLYVLSSGSNTSPYDTWAKAATSLVTAAAAAAAGDTIWVRSTHSESTAAQITIDCTAGTAAAPIRILGVSDSAEPPTTLATGALVATTDDTNRHINIDGHLYCYGVKFSVNDGGTATGDLNIGTADSHFVFEQCTFQITTAGAANIALGRAHHAAGANRLEFLDCTFSNSGGGSTLFFLYKPTLIRGGTVSTGASAELFGGTVAVGTAVLEGVDLSGMGATSYFIASASSPSLVIVQDCKLPAGISATNGTVDPGTDVRIVNSDSADTQYRFERYTSLAEEFSETTVKLDASDGTTTFSRKIVTFAGVKEYMNAYRSLPISVWNETVGSSQTATVEIVTDNVTLQDDEAWIEVEYLGTSGVPLGLITSDRAASVLATPANQTTSSASWTTTGLTTPVKQALSVSFTAQEIGLVRAYICLAKPSTTMYYNPKIDLS